MDDHDAMGAAIAAAMGVRATTSPNPWVGAVVLDPHGEVIGVGATEPAGGRHAEVVALDRAGSAAEGGTLVCTLEPCCHHGRTPPCTARIVESGVRRVVIGVLDPDRNVAGRGADLLRSAGVIVTTEVREGDVTRQLEPYLHHRRTGRPYVVCKLATTLDGATAAVDGTSRWITGPEARRDVHRMRSESDAVLVGAGTVRSDDPELTVRHVEGRDPQRVVLGAAPPGARVHPCLQWHGSLEDLLDDLGGHGVLQLLVEGGARTAGAFHEAGLVDRYVVYLAPALMGGRGGRPAIDARAAASIGELWRGQLVSVERVGDDLRIEMVPTAPRTPAAPRPDTRKEHS